MARIQGVHAPSRYTGLITSNNALDLVNDIDVAVGSCFDSTGQNVLTFSTAITKRLDAVWAVGTNQGGLDTGSKASNSSYHIHLISNGVNTDVLFSLSATAPTMPSGYNVRRRIGSFTTDGVNSIVRYVQNGDIFTLFGSLANTISVSTSQGNHTIAGLPSGTPLLAQLTFSVNTFSNGAVNAINVTSPDANAGVPVPYSISPTGLNFYNGVSGASGTSGDFSTPIHSTNGIIHVMTSTGQIRAVMNSISSAVINTLFGWRDLNLN